MSKRARRGVIDPRLLRYARVTRPFITCSIGLGFVSTLLLIAQAWLLAYAVAGTAGGKNLAQLGPSLALLAAVVAARAVVAWAAELIAMRSSTLAKRQLRAALLQHLTALSPGYAVGTSSGELATLASHALDRLDAYFSLYLPQLVLAVLAPAAVLAAVFAADWVAATIIVFTLPLIPVFMALVGATTRARTEVQLRALQRLGAHFLDVVSGLKTLKVFGRAKAQQAMIREFSERQRETASATFRLTFLSSLTLELLATISVALVAVAVGLRLLAGGLDFQSALFVLVLAPEAYLPLRLLGANFHASADGMSAAQQVFAVLDTALPTTGGSTAIPAAASSALALEGVTVRYRDYAAPALGPVSLRIEPAEVVALTGPSGSGKSTLLNVLLGFVAPATGSVWIGDRELRELSLEAWRRQIAWLPQRPHLFAGSIEQNIRLARPDASDHEVWAAAEASGLGSLVADRGLGARLGERGSGLSAGERQRVALARAFLRDAPMLLLDEPTANLDGRTEREVLVAIRRLIEGRTAILVCHRPGLAALSDRVVELGRVGVPA